MEVWGGATFDTMHRFLQEDPWMRPRILRKYIKKTPFTMLLRGQNLVGYRHYADDVVRAFVDKACEIGIDIFRCFDALNDYRNIETCVSSIKANGKHFQGVLCYSLTAIRLGGDVYNLNYFVSKAKELEKMGADSICIKDMAGLLSPYDAFDLVSALKKEINLPVQLHTHYTSGMASMTLLKAIEAGVDVVELGGNAHLHVAALPEAGTVAHVAFGVEGDHAQGGAFLAGGEVGAREAVVDEVALELAAIAGGFGAADDGVGDGLADAVGGIVPDLLVIDGFVAPGGGGGEVADVGFVPDFPVPLFDFIHAVAFDAVFGPLEVELAPLVVIVGGRGPAGVEVAAAGGMT